MADQPAWIAYIAKVPDSLSSAFPPAQLRQIAQVFADHVHEDPNGVADTNDLLTIMLELGVPVEASELSKALRVASLEGKAALDFKDFTLVLIHVIDGIQKSLANQKPEVFASEVVWQLVSTSVPMVVREGPPLPPSAHFGVAEEVEQDNRSADIDQRAGIAAFEERLQKLESASEGGPKGGTAQGKAKAGKPSPYSQLSWTNEICELERLHHEAPRKVWSRYEIGVVLRSLKLTDCQITTLDDALLDFPNAEKLDLSGNNISRLGTLPPKLTSLTLNSNTVESLASTSPARSLRYLAVTYNGLSSVPRGLEPSRFPLLSALDLSGNNLCDLDSVIQLLAPLSSLSHLFLIRNPLTLEPGYRRRVLYALRDLELLDDVPNTPTPETDDNKPPPSVSAMLLRVTIESLQGLPAEPGEAEAEGGGAVFGRVQVGILDTAVHTEEMPWSASLVGDEPADDASQGIQAAPKKKGKGGTPTPTDVGTEKPAPKVLTMRMSTSLELRDHLYFEGVQISVVQIRRAAPSEGAKDEEDEGKGETDETQMVVGTATVSLRAFLEPSFYSRGACLIHERVALNLEPSFAQGSSGEEAAAVPELKLSFELNPDDMVASFIESADSMVYTVPVKASLPDMAVKAEAKA